MFKSLLLISGIALTANLYAQKETSVLFIGNSFTFMNNMPIIFKEIATSKGKTVHVDSIVQGGKDLNYHASQERTYEKIRSKKWDYVIIQGHSNELAQPDSKVNKATLPYAQQLVDSVRQNNPCTQVVLYMTWGYKYGNPKWTPISSYDSMQYRIKSQYLRFADILNARISPVGEVWKTIRSNYDRINLYDPDNHHPSLAGSYISACTHYTTIFGESPYENTALIPLDKNVRQIIELNASQIVLNNMNQWRNIPLINPLESGFDLILQSNNLQLTDNSKNANWIEWDFGDGHVSIEKNPSHTYLQSGSFTITQKITNSCQSLVLQRVIEIK